MSAPAGLRTYTVRIRQRGQMTLPRAVREALDARGDTILTLIQVGESLLLTPTRPRLPDLTQQFTAIMEEEGVSLADLLQGLADERQAIWRERQARGHPRLR